ncbi:MAG: aminomethyltransferase family protein [Candidatus Binatia bacterium]
MSPQLHAAEHASGARFVRIADREVPAGFGDTETEWAAVRHRCGLLDAGYRGLLRMCGADRMSFLHGMLSNDVASLREGNGTYAALLTQQGKVVSDLRVYVLPDELWLDVPAERLGTVRAALERYVVADDVEWTGGDDWGPLVAIEGPRAAATVQAVTGEAVTDLQLFAHRELPCAGSRVRVVAASQSGERGYVLFGNPDAGASVWERCRAAGAEPVGMEALDVLRIEAGVPWYGRDMDDSTLLSEVGLDAAISRTKGCYLGQEVVERVASRGQVQRRLVGLVCEGRSVPPAAAKLKRDGQEVGWITSAAWSPARQAVIALGYARREYWDPGSAVHVASGDANLAANVVALPFYRSPHA